ncbi:MAG TPA: hypothetical protein VER17_13675 [Tepidisphaeraceae bacterium]|nr:hypothetical protein [Tepidisphaeraceae bacterium]
MSGRTWSAPPDDYVRCDQWAPDNLDPRRRHNHPRAAPTTRGALTG